MYLWFQQSDCVWGSEILRSLLERVLNTRNAGPWSSNAQRETRNGRNIIAIFRLIDLVSESLNLLFRFFFRILGPIPSSARCSLYPRDFGRGLTNRRHVLVRYTPCEKSNFLGDSQCDKPSCALTLTFVMSRKTRLLLKVEIIHKYRNVQ